MTGAWPHFRDVDWEDLYPRLLLATKGRLSRVRWRGQQWATAPMGLLAEDFIQTAIKEAMGGERRYDPSKSLFKNLCQIVSSEVSNIVQSYENKNVEHEDDGNIINFVGYQDSPETAAIYTQMVDRFLIYLEARDPPAKQVAEQIILCDLVKSLELSIELQRPVSDIENIKKRLRRLCREYQEHESKPVLSTAVKKTSGGGS